MMLSIQSVQGQCVPCRSRRSTPAAFSGHKAVASTTRRTSALQSAPVPQQKRRVIACTSEFDVDNEPVVRDDSLGPRDDDVLPADLGDALREAALATSEAIQRGASRTQVELLLTEFWDPVSGPIFPNRGDQERFWRMTRRFIEQLAAATGAKNVNAVYPDSGVAAMLSYQWKKAAQEEAAAAGQEQEQEQGGGEAAAAGPLPFRITSLNDRLPVSPEDDLVVVACPDPFVAEECMRLVRQVGEQDEKEGREERPVVLFNPRLSSGDVGLGLNARRLRENFTKNFVVTYSLRPIADVGSVFRRYPGMWKVFLEEEGLPGRYKLIAERPARPAGEMLDYLIQQATQPEAALGPDGKPQAPSLLSQVGTVLNSLQYFMRSLSK